MSPNPFDRNKVKEARLGELITEPGAQNQRDAIHIAVVPIVASSGLDPGQHIGVLSDGTRSSQHGPFVGIVDPFLKQTVHPGETFWAFLYQGQVTTLRHEWTHPAFPDVQYEPAPAQDLTDARVRMAQFAGECHHTLESFLEEITSVARGTDSSVFVGDNEGAEKYPQFWSDFTALTGVDAPSDGEIWFSCGC